MNNYQVTDLSIFNDAGEELISFDFYGNPTLGGAASTTTDAPAAAGDVDAATDSSKGSPDTGIEDVAVIGGLAIVAGAAIAFTRKRK